MEEKKTDTYFGERIAHIHKLRSSELSAKNKIKSLVSIADDSNYENADSLPLRDIYDLPLLCDTMMDMAEKRMVDHEIIIFEEFYEFIELFNKMTMMQKIQTDEKSDLIISFNEIEKRVDKLKSEFFKLEEAAKKKNYYRKCLEEALCTIEQLDKEKKELEREMSDKIKEAEEQVLMSLIEIANNKSLSTRQGIKSLLQDYMSKNNVHIGSSDFHEKLAALDDEKSASKVTNVAGDLYDIHDNATVNQKQQ